MREHKYRVWDENLEEMVYFNLHERDWHLTDGRYPVMDYIGLRDNDGNAIYEGDIVKCNEGFQGQGDFVEVKYDNDCAEFIPFGSSDWAVPTNECEVIGNICENPELLKEVSDG